MLNAVPGDRHPIRVDAVAIPSGAVCDTRGIPDRRDPHIRARDGAVVWRNDRSEPVAFDVHRGALVDRQVEPCMQPLRALAHVA